jgi:CHASE3 domain sensor protein
MKSSFLQYNRRYLLLLVIVVPILIAAAFFYVSHQIRVNQTLASRWVRHSYLVRDKLYAVETLLNQAEGSQRSYLLTGRPEYIGPFVIAITGLPFETELLRVLVADNKSQEKLAADLQETIQALLDKLIQSYNLRSAGDADAALQAVNNNRPWDLMNSARAQIVAMRATEDKLLVERDAISEEKLDLKENISTVLLLTSTAVVVGAGILFLRLQLLQNIITVCAWTQRVNYRGKWMRMEEFLWERFGVKVSHGISEEAFDGVMGIVGKKLTVSERHNEPQSAVQEPNEGPSAS